MHYRCCIGHSRSKITRSTLHVHLESEQSRNGKLYKGPFKCYVTQMGVGGVKFSGNKRYEGVRFNVTSVTRGSKFQEKSGT